MDLQRVSSIEQKIRLLNKRHQAAIFIVTGPNGTGKTVLTKRLLTILPFHQTFNLGAIAKTIRYVYQDARTTRLENFSSQKITKLFTPIVQFACGEYQKNGVNVLIDGVQIDTASDKWSELITGGIVLQVDQNIKYQRNQKAETHFNRKMEISLSDHYHYQLSDQFAVIDNNDNFTKTFNAALKVLDEQLSRQLRKAQIQQVSSKISAKF